MLALSQSSDYLFLPPEDLTTYPTDLVLSPRRYMTPSLNISEEDVTQVIVYPCCCF